MKIKASQQELILSLLGGFSLGLAWLQLGTDNNEILAPILTLVSILTLLLIIKSKRAYQFTLIYGLSAYLLAFYWLIDSINSFAGYPIAISLLIFFLFCLTQALIFPLIVLLYRKLAGTILAKLGLSLSFSWVAIKYIFPEIFPWDLAHTLVSITQIAGLASYGGSFLVSFIVLAIIETALNSRQQKFAKASCLTIITITIGLIMIQQTQSALDFSKTLKVSVIQGPIKVQKYQGVSYLAANAEDYWRSSLEAIKTYQPELIIWPETVIVNPVSRGTRSIGETPLLPYHPATNFLTGAISTDFSQTEENRSNSVFLIKQNQTIPTPYHKQILMPFGEYMPLASIFPTLNNLNPNLAIVTAGTKTELMEVNAAKISPLICYEDLVGHLARQASQNGANLLVNHTNDAWFGNSPAQYQHNRIARYRAIENQKYLIRSTNSGLSTVINEKGQMTQIIPPFSSARIDSIVNLRNRPTIYNKFYGYLFPLLIVVLTLFSLTIKSKS